MGFHGARVGEAGGRAGAAARAMRRVGCKGRLEALWPRRALGAEQHAPAASAPVQTEAALEPPHAPPPPAEAAAAPAASLEAATAHVGAEAATGEAVARLDQWNWHPPDEPEVSTTHSKAGEPGAATALHA